MKKKEILNNYNKKIKLINNYNNYYYDKNQPIVDDQKYDQLKKEILQLETNFSSACNPLVKNLPNLSFFSSHLSIETPAISNLIRIP